MPEQLQKIINRVVEWWKKFNTKQKALMISLTSIVIVALVILGVVMTRPTYTTLIDCENAKSANQVKEILDADGTIDYKVSNSTHFEVNVKDESAANMLLGSNDIATAGYDISKADVSSVVDGSFSRTEADKQKLNKEYLEQKLQEDLAANDLINSAKVSLDLPTDDGTLISRMQEGSASVSLDLKSDMDEDQAYSIARFVATQIGNESTKNITILDQKTSMLLYSGADQDSASSVVSTNLSTKQKTQNMVKDEVKNVLVKSGIFSDVQVGINLDMNFDEKTVATHEYYAPDGQTDGMKSSESNYESESEGGTAAEPGTDSNGDNTDYMLQDNDYTHSTVTDSTINYQNNERITNEKDGVGNINYDGSSITVVATHYVVYKEDTLRASGALDNMTFDEYIAANSTPVKETNIDQDYYTMIANATGFPEANIHISVVDEPIFQYSTGGRSLADYMQIVLAVLVLLLLGFVVFRSTRKEKEPELEEELSVESLLESTKENQEESLENIGYNEKSEVRVLIEKFVEENPEAAASLLRNWLNEEWE